jgi:colicin import membrane protein
MAKKLKTFQTSLGFYDLAVAAPSMKAALEAWGAGSNLFHQGAASETDDPDVVAATMSKPGVVLKRPAGSNGRFGEHSGLPTGLGRAGVKNGREKSRARPKKRAPSEVSEKAARKAADGYDREQRRREAERRREEAALRRERERREKAIAKAQEAFERAEREHDGKAQAIEAERAAIEERADAEESRWQQQKQKLTSALRRARQD